VTIYRGGAFPPEYGGNSFVCEPVMNLVHRDVLVPKGASFRAKRGDPDREFFASTDPWCRPVNLSVGPDGALYVCDMYRAVIEHPDYIPKDIQKKLDLDGGKDYGRIYRIVHESAPRPKRPKMSKANGRELAAELENPNAWWRTTAQRLLVERQDRGAIEPLLALARGSGSPLARLHALWTLQGLGGLSADDVARAFQDSDPGIREHALRLAAPAFDHAPILRKRALELAGDPSPRIRFQLALALGDLRGEDILPLLVKLTLKDAADPWIRAALLTSGAHVPVPWLSELKREAPSFLERPEPGALDLVRALAQVVAAERNSDTAEKWIQAARGGERPLAWQREALSCLPALRRAGVKIDGLGETMAGWIAAAEKAVPDGSRPPAERVEAIGLLALIAPADFSPLVSAKEPQEVQVAAVRATATPKILENWSSLTGPVRREVLNVLIGRPEGLKAVLDRLEKGQIRPVELEAFHRDSLLRHPDSAVRTRAKALLAPKGSEEREEVIREMTAKLEGLRGDRARGEKVYLTNCATCHRLAGKGTKVGPDLDGVIGRDPKALLVDVLDPSRAMDPSYQMYVVRTTSNETVNGVLASETPAGVTLRRAGGEETTVLRRDIAEIKAWPVSMMPEGIENNVKPQDFADLLEFLRRPPGR
jgi:putative heme-binding domain-containing protein